MHSAHLLTGGLVRISEGLARGSGGDLERKGKHNRHIRIERSKKSGAMLHGGLAMDKDPAFVLFA